MNPSEIGLINAPTLRTNPYKNHFQSQFLLIGSFSVTTIHHVSIIFSYVPHGFLRKHHPAPMVFNHLRARARDAAGAALGSGEGAAPGLSKAAAVQTTGWELVLLLCHGFLDEDGWYLVYLVHVYIYIYILTVIVYYIHTLIWCKLT